MPARVDLRVALSMCSSSIGALVPRLVAIVFTRVSFLTSEDFCFADSAPASMASLLSLRIRSMKSTSFEKRVSSFSSMPAAIIAPIRAPADDPTTLRTLDIIPRSVMARRAPG